ncbi:unnamed protein product [Clavelina lepadiformis]|uniref:EF-hand domain-containing protein n=1 Tax=Clavelina lepadiformis TaxID=159417 RepID=A0ABP0FK82_CLALP
MYMCLSTFYILAFVSFSCVICTGTGVYDKQPTFQDGNMVRDLEHLKKELSGLVDVAVDSISYEHMEFYFFRLHDLNKDGSLDGNELYSALTETSSKVVLNIENATAEEKEKYFIDAVDVLLKETDENDNGLVSWTEYLSKTRSFIDM